MTTSPNPSTSCAKPTGAPNEPRPLLLALLLVASVLAVFHDAARYGFVNWDDPLNYCANPYVATLSAANLHRLWHAPYEGLYIPVTYTVIAAIGHITALPFAVRTDANTLTVLNAAAFHTVNIALHCINVLLVFSVLRLAVKREWAAFCGALLFALHPVQVESVAWISEMRGVLGAAFALGALVTYLRYATASSDGNRSASGGWLFIATILFVLALLSKPSYVTLPLIACAFDRLSIGRKWASIAPAASLWLLIVVLCIAWTRAAQTLPSGEFCAVWQRPFIAGDALAFYMAKLVWPWPLGLDYGRTPHFVLHHAWGYATWIVPGIALFAAWRVRIARPNIWLGTLTAFAALLPVLGLVPFVYQTYSTVADRYMYLPMLGISLVAASLLSAARSRVIGIYGVLVLMLASVSFIQQRYWRDSLTLMRHAVAANPRSSTMRLNLGVSYVNAGMPDEGYRAFEYALRLSPQSAVAELNIGLILLHRGNTLLAETAFRAAVADAPGDAFSYCGLGNAFLDEHRDPEALAEFEHAASIMPDLVDAHRGLAAVLERHNQPRNAAIELELVVRLTPSDPAAHYSLGEALEAAGLHAAAHAEYERALALAPDSQLARRKLGQVK